MARWRRRECSDGGSEVLALACGGDVHAEGVEVRLLLSSGEEECNAKPGGVGGKGDCGGTWPEGGTAEGSR